MPRLQSYKPNAITFEIETSRLGKSGEFYIDITTLTANVIEFETVGPPGTVTYSALVYRGLE